ncbi:MAG: hypothetical protein KAI17_20535, partial [Thiotrichaceae bacterium]|nr:hypothetical protein [Thiotrichaceae bacterium]
MHHFVLCLPTLYSFNPNKSPKVSFMFAKLFRKLFGSRNDREIKRYSNIVDQINTLEEAAQALTDQELLDKTEDFRKQIKAGKT